MTNDPSQSVPDVERIVTITFPVLNETAKIIPSNLLERCDVTAINGAAAATSVVGKCFTPGSLIPVNPPPDAKPFAKSTSDPTKWTVSNLPQGCVGNGTKKCTVKVWAVFPGVVGFTSASREFVGTSGGTGAWTCP